MAKGREIPTVATNAVLANLQKDIAATTTAPVSLLERPWTGQWNLRGNPEDKKFAAAVHKIWYLDLPAANRVADDKDVAIFWLAPDEWLITSDDGAALTDQIDMLSKALANQHHALTDLSDNRTALELKGPAAATILSTGCGLDLRNWQPGQCAQSHFSRAQILLQQLDDTPAFRIYVRNSFADYLTRFLLAEISDLA